MLFLLQLAAVYPINLHHRLISPVLHTITMYFNNLRKYIMHAETRVRMECIFKSDRHIYRNTFYSVTNANVYEHTIWTYKRIADVHLQPYDPKYGRFVRVQ